MKRKIEYTQYEKRLLYKFIKTRLFNMLGISNAIKDSFDISENWINEDCCDYVYVKEGKTYFGFKTKNGSAFYIDRKVNENNINWCSKILEALYYNINFNRYLFNQDSKLSYFYDNSEKNHKYIALSESYTSKYEKQLFDFAIERGIINWIVSKSTESNLKIERLFSILENWACKTYEGHNVCFGLLIDTKECGKPTYKENAYCDSFLDFLDDEYSATLSDGISSMLQIDANCNFHKYVSLTENDVIDRCEINNSVLPYRFIQIIKSKVKDENVGVFLIQNGDIIVAKNQKIVFIKRNGKWLNFQYASFEIIIKEILGKDTKEFSSLLQHCFSTCIDVSLTHTGGIIAVIANDRKDDFYNISNIIDTINQEKSNEELYFDAINQQLNTKEDDHNLLDRMFKEKFPNEDKKRKNDIKKRITKRNMLLKLLDIYKKDDGQFNYIKIDRKLRTELTGMDGASIIDEDGNVISFGAIIKNNAGSSGGGRGAAAKALSEYGGFAIKISTDGYIEVYINGNKVYSIK